LEKKAKGGRTKGYGRVGSYDFTFKKEGRKALGATLLRGHEARLAKEIGQK